MATNDPNLNITITGEDKFSPVVQRFESGLIRSVGAISSAIATLSTLAFPVTQAAALEREMANVAKTTGFTSQQIANLTRDLAQMSLTTDTSAVDLAKIAAAAGQQGLGREGTDGIKQFTESVARMASVLDLTAEDAGRSIGKIANIFQIPLREIENTVSAINQLSNNSTARANELINVLKRLGDAGGSLKFTQALALSATALDLGASPEVAGTTLSKFQSALKVRNTEFAQLLGRSRAEVARQASEDGFKLFTDVLEELNKVTLVDREKLISKLFGGGRINALFDKNLQDNLKNAPILLRNLKQAEFGEESGTSAIKEQQTVLQTFTKQVVILGNAFKELGSTAGKDLLIPLTGYVSQLRGALQNDGVKDFVQAVVKSFGQLAGVLVSTTKFLAELNINWTNFAKVFQVFVVLKMVDAIRSLIGLMPSLRGSLALIAGTNAAEAATDVAGKAKQISAWSALKAAIAEATAAVTVYSTARQKAAALDADLLQKEKAAADALARERLLRRDAEAKALQAKTAKNNVNIARSELSQTIANGDKSILNANTTGQQAITNAQRVTQERLQAAERAHQAQMAAIEAEFRGVRSNADKAAKAGLIASEEAHYNRQVAALQAAGAKRIALAREFATALVGVATTQAQQEIAIEERKVAAKRALAGQAAATSEAAALALAGASAATQTSARAREAATAASLGNAAQVAQVSKLRVALQGLSAAFALVGTAVSALLKAAGPLFFWLTLIFTVLDATGILEKLPGLFTRLTDAIGLTTKAARDKEIQDKKDHEAAIQQKKDLDDLIERYHSLRDVKTGLLDVKQLNELETEVKGAKNTKEFQSVAPKVANLIEGNTAERTQTEKDIAEMPAKLAKITAEIKAKTLELERAKANFTQQASVTGEVDLSGTQSNIDTLEEEIEALKKQAASVSPAVRQAMVDSLALATTDSKKIHAIIAGIFTDQAGDFLLSQGPIISAMNKRIDDLNAERDRKTKEQSDGITESARKEAATAVKNLDEQIKSQKKLLSAAFSDIRKELENLGKDTNVTDATKKSLDAVLGILELGSKSINTFSKGLLDFRKTGKELFPNAGNLLNNDFNKPPKEANKPGNIGDTESEGRRRVKAFAELRKAQNAAEAAVAKEHNDQMLDINRRAYDRGLIDLETFYNNKEALDELNLDKELARIKLDIEQKQADKKAPELKESDRIRIDAEIATLEGQRKVVQSKINDLPRTIAEDTTDALKRFKESILQTQIEMMDVFGVTDFGLKFEIEMQLARSQLETTLNAMRASIGKNGVTQQLIDKVELQLTAKAVEKAFNSIAEKTRLATADLERYINRLAILNRNGKLTDIEAETLENRARARIAQEVKKEIEEMTIELDRLRQKGETVASSTAYKKLAEQIEQAKDRFIELREAADATARAINQSVESSLSDAFKQLSQGDKKSQQQLLEEAKRLKEAQQPGYKTQNEVFVAEEMKSGVQKALETFREGVTGTIRDVLAKDLSQTVIKAFGGGGTGGLGGLISSILRPGEEIAREKETIGLTEANAMYVELTSASKEALKPIPPIAPPGTVPNPNDPFADRTVQGIDLTADSNDLGADIKRKGELLLTDVATTSGKILATVGGLMGGKTGGALFVFGTFFSKFKKIFSDEAAGLTRELDGGGLGIGELFKTLGKGISDLFKSLSGLFGGGGGDLLGAFAGIFHEGGVVGEGGRIGMYNPALFTDAVRYHTGGLAGLQPNEVPAILQRGEEVLTRNDPRHRDNAASAHPAAAAAPTQVQLSVHPDALTMTLRQWLEGELARTHANR